MTNFSVDAAEPKSGRNVAEIEGHDLRVSQTAIDRARRRLKAAISRRLFGNPASHRLTDARRPKIAADDIAAERCPGPRRPSGVVPVPCRRPAGLKKVSMSVVDHITRLDVIQRTSLDELARRITAPSPQPVSRTPPANCAEVPNTVSLEAAFPRKCLLTVMFGSRKTDTSAIDRLAARLLASLEGEGDDSVNELWPAVAVLSAVALVWALTAAILVFASRRHRVLLAIRCPMLRRNVQVTGDEWGGRLLDVRRCSGLHSSTDFELCGIACLEPDECATATLGLPGNHLFKGGAV